MNPRPRPKSVLPSSRPTPEPESSIRVKERSPSDDQAAVLEAMIREKVEFASKFLDEEDTAALERLLRAEFLEVVPDPAIRALYKRVGFQVPEP